MSIRGAVSELNEEIRRLTEIRDSLLQTESGRQMRSPGSTAESPTAKKPRAAKKTATAKKTAPVKLAPTKRTPSANQKAAGKRVVSDATRKKMSEAAKARSAVKKSIAAK